MPLNPIDEIFGEGWWDKDKAKEWHKLTLEQNALHQIDRQNTQIGQIEPNSTDQNPPLTESNHSDNAKNGEQQNEMTSNAEDEQKRKIVNKFLAIKDEFKQKGKFPYKERMKAELKRAGFKKSYKEINETVAKELGLSIETIYKWKRKLGQNKPNHKHSHSEQKELMKLYYEIKDQNPTMSVGDIAKMLKIGTNTLYRWKKQFKLQQLHPNSVDSVENAGSNVQEIGNSNSGST
uniref:Transposase n=1 Tax=Globodera rostochiensis TaxID=31243 RepID=A0A914HRP4_GLORO